MAIRNINDSDQPTYDLREVLRKKREAEAEHRDPRVIAASTEPYWTQEDVDVRQINVDLYQRVINEKRVRAMVRDWKPLIAGVLELSRRRDGSYFVIDGQHRVSALLQMADQGPRIVRAVVWHGLSPKQEAEKFAEAQDAKHRRPIVPEDTHNARVYAEDDRALAINAAVEAVGFRIGKASGNESLTKLPAVQKLYDVEERYGLDILAAALQFIAKVWGTTPPPEGPLVGGVAQFMAMYPDARYTPLMRRLATNYAMKQFVERASASGRDAGYTNKADQITWKLYREHNAATRGAGLIHGFEDAFTAHRAWVRSTAAQRRWSGTR